MSRVFKVGMLHEKITKNPVLHVQTRCKFDYRAIVMSPQQTLAILNSLPAVLHPVSSSPVPRQRSVRRRFWRCAGRTCVGRNSESGCQRAGPTARTGKPRRKHRTATSRCTRSWLPIFVRGINKRLTGRTRTLCFRRSRQKARSPLPFRIRRRPSPAGSESGRSADCGRRTLRPSQSSSLAFQLADQ